MSHSLFFICYEQFVPSKNTPVRQFNNTATRTMDIKSHRSIWILELTACLSIGICELTTSAELLMSAVDNNVVFYENKTQLQQMIHLRAF